MPEQTSYAGSRSLAFLAALRSNVQSAVVAARPWQWIKNLFVPAPLLFGGKLGDPHAWWYAALGTGAFCLLSSAIYVFNDLLDAPRDRLHPEKRHRPIASGALSARGALISLVLFLFLGLWMASHVSGAFAAVGLAYLVLMTAYTVGLKQLIIADAIVIAVGFVLRVVAGALAVDVEPSHWLVACTFILALFLAFSKRRQELLQNPESAAAHRSACASYTVALLDQVNSILVAAAIVSYALYTVSPETVARFGTHDLIYGTVFVVYGMLRYLALLQTPRNGGDPSRMVFRDVPLFATLCCWALFNALIIYGWPLKDWAVQ